MILRDFAFLRLLNFIELIYLDSYQANPVKKDWSKQLFREVFGFKLALDFEFCVVVKQIHQLNQVTQINLLSYR